MDKIYQSDFYSISKNKVTQGKFEALALSSTELTSNYESPVNLEIRPALSFKFSLNGKDNEMASGKNHLVNIISYNGSYETPVISFGKQYIDQTPVGKAVFLKPDTKFTIRLDMRSVLAEFKETGYFITYDGTKVYQTDFKGVFVAGSIVPLIWDFDNLGNHKELQLHDGRRWDLYHYPGNEQGPAKENHCVAVAVI